MPTHGKPSDWRALDLDAVQKLYEVDSLYKGGIAGLVALATPSSPKAAAELDRAFESTYISPIGPQVRTCAGRFAHHRLPRL